jgi:hypothetical protein
MTFSAAYKIEQQEPLNDEKQAVINNYSLSLCALHVIMV